MPTWNELHAELTTELQSDKGGETWLGAFVNKRTFTVSINDKIIEIAALVCPVDRLDTFSALQLSARAPAGGMVLDKGSQGERYLLRQVLPLDIASTASILGMMTVMEQWIREVVAPRMRRAPAAAAFTAFAD